MRTLLSPLILSVAVIASEAQQASEQFVVAKGLTVQPFATQGQLSNPASIDVDDRGRVWVAEAFNYRKKTRKAGDRILILEDSNGNGRADKTTVFYQNPDVDGVHGVCVLGNRAIISAPDRILLLTDTDGDDKADAKKVLFTGKVLNPVNGQHDHAIHAVMFGPDGRLYFNFGNFNAGLWRADGTLVKDVFGTPVDNSRKPYQEGMVIRCEMDGSRVEVLGYNFRNNWEVTVDSFGSMWQSDNDNGSSSCRVNFVMEYGNYGYRDERTGAGYRSKRTNMETTMQRQMWHQNDPGVIPNLLITGRGAPTGILVYEGDLLPEPFRGQMIHAEPGRNVVWAFPARQVGAGYQASITNLVHSQKDRNYRPSDISVAPDGSLIIADWFDPVDCCHRTINDAGRIFRVAPPGHAYVVPVFDFKTPDGAAKALRNPNLSVRYKAWTALQAMQEKARPALVKMAADKNPRIRARAMWALAAIKDGTKDAIEKAVQDEDDNLRALALRIARRHGIPIEPLVKRLMDDKSALVRRECAVSLHRVATLRAAELWAELALQHDGKDRWYLEALGIGEKGNETACLHAWLKKVGDSWKAPAGRDVVWRSRAPEAAGLLAKLVLDPKVPKSEHPRLMRAFDFHSGETKEDALATLVLNLDTPTKSKEAERPNIVLFLVDDMGWMDSTPYGSKYYETPNMDKLAKQSMLFTDAYAHPLCSPTRASILTGQYPSRHGITTASGHQSARPAGQSPYPKGAPATKPFLYAASKNYLDPALITLPKVLAKAGYSTGHFGKWHLGLAQKHWPEKHGFQVAFHAQPSPGPPRGNYFSPYGVKLNAEPSPKSPGGTITDGPKGEYITDRLTDESIAFIEANKDKPFYLNLWHYGVHGPWGHKEEYTKQFAKKTDPRGEQRNPIMASMLKSIDQSLGRVLAKLDELDLTKNTLFIFYSDNGGNVHSNAADDAKIAKIKPDHPRYPQLEDWRKWAGPEPPTNNAPLREGKARIYEGGQRVPLMARWPGRIEPGSTSDAVVAAIDLYPTLLDVLDLPKPKGHPIDGESILPVLEGKGSIKRKAYFTWFPHLKGAVSVRQGDYKLIRRFEQLTGYPDLVELYDLTKDIGETRNLAGKMPGKVKELQALIDGFVRETGALYPKPNPNYDPNWKPTANKPAFNRPSPEEFLRRRDTNKDGSITLKEYIGNPKGRNIPALNKQFTRRDVNKDGKLTLKELKRTK